MNRREMLRQIAAAPVLSCLAPRHSNADCLAQESARGFQLLGYSSRFIVLPAVRAVPLLLAGRLLAEVRSGRFLVWESAAWFASPEQQQAERGVLRQVFGVSVRPAVAASSLFVEYRVPSACTLVRSFSGVVPVCGSGYEVLATLDRMPVAIRAPIGRGWLIFLGSMLGPQLYAGDVQAIQVATQIFAI